MIGKVVSVLGAIAAAVAGGYVVTRLPNGTDVHTLYKITASVAIIGPATFLALRWSRS